MATPPFDIDVNKPGDAAYISIHAPDERSFRDIVESWLLYEHGASGYHKFLVADTAGRNSAPGWASGSMMFNTSFGDLQVASGPSTWNPGSGLATQNPGFALTMVFHQSVAPLGWTLINVPEHQDALIRSRNVGSGALAGAQGFSFIFSVRSVAGTVAGHSLVLAELPSHRHTFNFEVIDIDEEAVSAPIVFDGNTVGTGNSGVISLGSTGGGAAHAHGWSGSFGANIGLKFYDVISCVRNPA